jgi:hypothetical protein
LIDRDTAVKRALLTEISRLAKFFGKQRSNDLLLSHLITYFNDSDWMLRAAFLDSVLGVARYVGAQSLKMFILPILRQAIAGIVIVLIRVDSEELVVERVLDCFASLSDLQLLEKYALKELISTSIPLLCHPSVWIRHAAAGFLASFARLFPFDMHCIFFPMLKPFFLAESKRFAITEVSLLENLMFPVCLNSNIKINRVLFDEIVRHFQATQASKISSEKGEALPNKLKDMTMTDDEKEMLIAMKDYILKVSKSAARNSTRRNADLPWIIAAYASSKFVPLKNFAVELNTSFLTIPNQHVMRPPIHRGASNMSIRSQNFDIPGNLSTPGRVIDQSYMQVSSQDALSRSPLSLLTQNMERDVSKLVPSPDSMHQDSDTVSISASELSERGMRRGSVFRVLTRGIGFS